MPPAFDYTTCQHTDLEMLREPRKSVIKVKHKPSGAIAESPVVPGPLSAARFRRATNLPKENRVKDMDGYIEGGPDDKVLFPIIAGETPKNEYLEALAKDPAALKASFEGTPKQSKSAEKQQDEPPAPSATPQAPVAAPPAQVAPDAAPATVDPPAAPAAQTPEVAATPPASAEAPQPAAEPAPTSSEDPELGELDDILATLEQ